MVFLVLIFSVVALIYASVGFGGGSTYNALLLENGVDFRLIPIIALTCNLAVTLQSSTRAVLHRRDDVRRALPILLTSMPAAVLGGLTPISEQSFRVLLGTLLIISALWLAYDLIAEAYARDGKVQATKGRLEKAAPTHWLTFLIGSVIGYIAGISGIGGGIFLAPMLHFMRWGSAQSIAVASSIFIAANSISGLVGQGMRTQSMLFSADLMPYIWLLPAVMIGGFVGSRLGMTMLPPRYIKGGTALLVAYVGIRILGKALSAMTFGA